MDWRCSWAWASISCCNNDICLLSIGWLSKNHELLRNPFNNFDHDELFGFYWLFSVS
jgi:hypothetical protein